jgi:hypothetical protein
MRIALLLYGRLKYCKELHNHIIDIIGNSHTIDIFHASDYENPQTVSEFVELYKPVKHIHERIIHANQMAIYPGRIDNDNYRVYDMGCHFINKLRVFTLLEEHINETNAQYDIVMCTRINLLYDGKFCFSEPLQENTIYIPSNFDYHGGLNDRLAFGTFDVMKKYCSIYKYSVFILENKLSILHPENINRANVQYHGLYIERFDLHTVLVT